MSDRVENPVEGFHFRSEFGPSGAIEVNLLRVDPRQPEVLLEVFGRRASDSQPDSVVIALPVDAVAPVTGALLHAYRLGRDGRIRARANDEKLRGEK